MIVWLLKLDQAWKGFCDAQHRSEEKGLWWKIIRRAKRNWGSGIRRIKAWSRTPEGTKNCPVFRGMKILYLGAANGTTVSHVSDMSESAEWLFCRILFKSMRDLMSVSKSRKISSRFLQTQGCRTIMHRESRRSIWCTATWRSLTRQSCFSGM